MGPVCLAGDMRYGLPWGLRCHRRVRSDQVLHLRFRRKGRSSARADHPERREADRSRPSAYTTVGLAGSATQVMGSPGLYPPDEGAQQTPARRKWIHATAAHTRVTRGPSAYSACLSEGAEALEYLAPQGVAPARGRAAVVGSQAQGREVVVTWIRAPGRSRPSASRSLWVSSSAGAPTVEPVEPVIHLRTSNRS